MTTGYDLHFYFDPVCPFAWMTSKWVRMVAAERDYRVDWRFISLRILNAHIDYASHFPPEYEEGHTAGLRLLRVCARVRAEHGRDAIGPLYEAMGTRIFDTSRAVDPLSASGQGSREMLEPLLADLGLPAEFADALDDGGFDDGIRAETEEALELTGRDVGTPILHFQPPEGTAFFGPVISRLPSAEDAGRLWDHVIGLASFPGFAEIKRSLRERPQLASFGVDPLSASGQGSRPMLEPLLADLGLPAEFADALEDAAFDDGIRAETEEALELTGRDVGTPILHFQPPEGTAFFGPVISRLPSADDAGRLWDHVIGLASFAGFAEIKRSLRERPQLASFGVDTESVGKQEDWHGGSRRLKK